MGQKSVTPFRRHLKVISEEGCRLCPIPQGSHSKPTLLSIYNMETTQMSINRGIDKEDVVHIHHGILLSHQKEWNNAICSTMDGARNDHTKPDRERQTPNYITYMWNLIVQMNLQNQNRVTDTENKHGYQGERWGRREQLRDWDRHIHTTRHKRIRIRTCCIAQELCLILCNDYGLPSRLTL